MAKTEYVYRFVVAKGGNVYLNRQYAISQDLSGGLEANGKNYNQFNTGTGFINGYSPISPINFHADSYLCRVGWTSAKRVFSGDETACWISDPRYNTTVFNATFTYELVTIRQYYDLSISVSGPQGRAGISSSTGSRSESNILAGSTRTVVAEVLQNGRFAGWSDGSSQLSRSIIISGNTSLSANFASKFVSVYVEGDGTAYVGITGTYNGRYYLQGDSVTVRAYPGASTVGFIGWYDHSHGTFINGNAIYTFTFGTSNVILTARFAAKQRAYTVDASDAQYGDVAIHPGGYVPDESEPAGTSYTAAFGARIGFVATIKDGTFDGVYKRGRFVGWYTDSARTQLKTADAIFNETVPSDYSAVTYYAKFVQAEVVTIDTEVSDGTSVVTDRGTVVITSTAVVDPSAHTYYSGSTTFEIEPPTGFHVHVAGWLVNGLQQPGATGNTFTGDISANSVVTAVVLRNQYKVRCALASASQGCGSASIQVMEGASWVDAPTEDIEHGTQCRAHVVLSASGERFFSKLIAEEAEVSVEDDGDGGYDYYFNATKAIDFTAHFGNVLHVVAKHIVNGIYEDEENGSASVAIAPESPSGLTSVSFTYGDTVNVRADNSDGEDAPAYFVGWHSVENGIPSASRILGMSASASVTPAVGDPLTYWAEFKNQVEQLAVRLSNNGTTYGTLSMVSLDGEGDIEEITQQEFVDFINEYYPSNYGSFDGASSGAADRYYKVKLGTRVLVSCVLNAAFDVQFAAWRLKTYIGREEFDNPDGTIYSTELSAEHIVSGNEVFVATYMTSLPAKASLRYVEGSSFAVGVIRLNPIGANAEQREDLVSGDFTPGTEVTAVAIPKNGYVFTGWYSEAAGINQKSHDSNYTFVKDSAAETIYAKFSQDVNAVYKWEGEDANKMMVWRSRRTQFAQPINLSSAAVCADGYPLHLKVAYASAPDPAADGWKEGEITVNNQDPRRLPMLRPERYVEVEVRSDKPVLRVAVASSMAGLLG